MERTIDVTALGELLIDFTESGLSPQGNPLLEANPGGAPCNLLAMLARLGHRTAFLGKVGRDAFGDMLRQRVSGVGWTCPACGWTRISPPPWPLSTPSRGGSGTSPSIASPGPT